MYRYILIILLILLSSSCPDNCLYCIDKNKCINCQNQFYLTENYKCIKKTIENCRMYKNDKQCVLCQPTFKIQNQICIKDLTGCLIRNIKGNCKQCVVGMALNHKGQCLGVMNCLKPQKKCKKCQNNYNLINNKCIYAANDCQIINPNGLCTKCKPGFKLNGFQCIPIVTNSLSNTQINLIDHCSLYSRNQNRCIQCSIGYSLSNGICTSLQKLYQQSSSAANSKITQISSNIFINSQSQSEFIYYNKTTIKLRKSKGDVLESNQKLIKIDQLIFGAGGANVQKNQKNCLIKSNMNMQKCKVCKDGYYLTKGICKKKLLICLKYNLFNFQCLSCNPQFSLKNGQCIDLNCEQSQFSKCTKCISNYQLHEQSYCYDPNCDSMQNGKCKKCKNGFSLSIDSFCVADLNNKCLKYQLDKCTQCKKQYSLKQNKCIDGLCQFQQVKNNSISCIKCKQGYTLNQNGICFDQKCMNSQNQICSQCIQDYYIDSTGQCIKIPPSCTNFNKSTKKCLTCTTGYFLLQSNLCIWSSLISSSSNSIIQNITELTINQILIDDPNCRSFNQKNTCLLCKDRYYLKNDKCIAIQAQCKNYARVNGSCLSCETGFVLYSEDGNNTFSCIAKINQKDINCLQFNIDTYCIRCRSQFYISKGICYKADSLCKTFKIYGGQCQSCYEGYELDGFKCVLLTQQPNCIKYDFQNVCKQCKLGYYLDTTTIPNKSICKHVSNLCKITNQFKGTCLSCYDEYILQNGGCAKKIKKVSNCKLINYYGKCTQCNSRYYLNLNTSSCQQVNPNCNDYDLNTGACKNCVINYKLIKQLGICVVQNIDQFCSNFTYEGLCNKCEDSYMINSQRKCVKIESFCMKYDQSSAQCIKCIDTHYLVVNQCVGKQNKQKVSQNCIKFDQYNFCTQCQPRYYLQAGECLKVNELCLAYQMQTGSCLSCIFGYSLVNKQCIQNNKNSTQQFPINCKLFSGNICIQCVDGYYLNYNSQIPQCNKVDFLCKNYNKINGDCIDCYEGYVVLNTKCIVFDSIGSLREERQILKN